MRNPIGALVRLLTIRARAQAVLELAEKAEQDPRLYRSATWWSRLVHAGAQLAAVVPLSSEVRTSMQNTVLKLTVLAGAAVSIVGQLAQPEVLATLPPKVQAYILSAASIAAIVAGVLHPSPSDKK